MDILTSLMADGLHPNAADSCKQSLDKLHHESSTRLQELASQDSMLHYVDCSSGYVNSTDVLTGLMPDGLHPNAAGQELLAKVSGDALTGSCMYLSAQQDMTSGRCCMLCQESFPCSSSVTRPARIIAFL